ncbi:uncharacterized protein FMAN_14204 [Fusarium mangiferae]|uniref:Uncharacterized protein n=1 Tax=Fusarium mangiferae TaxID=192010 RepID=A0A1L7UG11_FUSMA|nr:uncharacterized protein FMAN_14204 [Fusarium mangiferae]CVL08132.1 uncharacterized protein FMAN_14204 [Fusarium mangiferae]
MNARDLLGYIDIHHDMRNIPSTVLVYDFHSKRCDPESRISIVAKEWHASFIDGSTAVPGRYDWPIARFTFQAGQGEVMDGAYILKVAAVKLLGCRLPREWPPASYALNRPLNIPENANFALSIKNYSIMPSKRDDVYINALMGLVLTSRRG